MLGLGETAEEIIRTMDDLREAGCEVMTIGQYLAPSKEHMPVVRYVEPEEFEALRQDCKRERISVCRKQSAGSLLISGRETCRKHRRKE
jgi:lipoate synthase